MSGKLPLGHRNGSKKILFLNIRIHPILEMEGFQLHDIIYYQTFVCACVCVCGGGGYSL